MFFFVGLWCCLLSSLMFVVVCVFGVRCDVVAYCCCLLFVVVGCCCRALALCVACWLCVVVRVYLRHWLLLVFVVVCCCRLVFVVCTLSCVIS